MTKLIWLIWILLGFAFIALYKASRPLMDADAPPPATVLDLNLPWLFFAIFLLGSLIGVIISGVVMTL